MGCVDQATLELIKWQESQKCGISASASLPATHSKKESTEDILSSTHPSVLQQSRDRETSSQSDLESEEDSQEDETDTSEDEDDYAPNQRTPSSSNQQLPYIVMPEDHHPSPKRRRTNNDNHIATPYQIPPVMCPTYNTYSTGNEQLQVPAQRMHMAGHPASLGGFSLQHGGPSMALVPQNQNGMELGSTDLFGGYDLPLPQDYNSPGLQPNEIQDMLPVRTRPPPEVPQARKAKRYKSAKSADRVLNRRKKTTGEGETNRQVRKDM
jgi:hypothetical protein